jgi:hypothetical protein
MKKYLILLFVLFCVGCGEHVKVSGKVVYHDGEPVKAGIVYFEDDLKSYRGTIQDNGSFRLGRYKDGDGILKGKYDAYITGSYEEVISEQTGAIVKITYYIDPKYQDKNKAGLSFEITKSVKDLLIVVDKPTTPTIENKQPKL